MKQTRVQAQSVAWTNKKETRVHAKLTHGPNKNGHVSKTKTAT